MLHTTYNTPFTYSFPREVLQCLPSESLNEPTSISDLINKIEKTKTIIPFYLAAQEFNNNSVSGDKEPLSPFLMGRLCVLAKKELLLLKENMGKPGSQPQTPELSQIEAAIKADLTSSIILRLTPYAGLDIVQTESPSTPSPKSLKKIYKSFTDVSHFLQRIREDAFCAGFLYEEVRLQSIRICEQRSQEVLELPLAEANKKSSIYDLAASITPDFKGLLTFIKHCLETEQYETLLKKIPQLDLTKQQKKIALSSNKISEIICAFEEEFEEEIDLFEEDVDLFEEGIAPLPKLSLKVLSGQAIDSLREMISTLNFECLLSPSKPRDVTTQTNVDPKDNKLIQPKDLLKKIFLYANDLWEQDKDKKFFVFLKDLPLPAEYKQFICSRNFVKESERQQKLLEFEKFWLGHPEENKQRLDASKKRALCRYTNGLEKKRRRSASPQRGESIHNLGEFRSRSPSLPITSSNSSSE